METGVTTLKWRELLERAQNGAKREVADLVRSDLSPEGCLLNGYLVHESDPERAKELFAQAKASTDVDVVHQAAIYEARAYEYLGQPEEGRILIRLLLDQDLKPTYRAQALLVLAVFQVNTPKRALTTLNQIAVDGLSAGLVARVFTLRGKLHSDLIDYDAALVAYAGAAAYFEEAGDPCGVAHVLNNRAGVEQKLNQIAAALKSVDAAISLVPKGYPYLAHFIDRKAQILIDAQQFVEAERLAVEGVALVRGTDRQAVLCENLCTLGRAHSGLENYVDAMSAFVEAAAIAEQLDDPELLFRVTTARKESAQKYAHEADAQLANLALRTSGGSLRAAAKKLGLSHSGIIKLLARNSRKWKPTKPQRSIFKPRK